MKYPKYSPFMKTTRFFFFAISFLLACNGFSLPGKTEIKVMQFNIWQEGTMVEGGFDAIADEIARLNPDFVTLSETRNYRDTRFCDRITDALRQRGKTYYSFYSYDSGLLSKYPIKEHRIIYAPQNDEGSLYKMVAEAHGCEFAVYTAHLDYRSCAYYEARGYDGSKFTALPAPVTDLERILYTNRKSKRIAAIRAFTEAAKEDIAANRIVILGGDFNEPSHLDWTEATKNMFDHHGLVVPWDCTVALEKAGFIDAYRKKYPNPVTHPGFTFPADNPNVDLKRLVWSPDADDRDRIDYIFYYPDGKMTLKSIRIVGPQGDIVRGKRETEKTKDPIEVSPVKWMTDHKAVFSVFSLKTKKN